MKWFISAGCLGSSGRHESHVVRRPGNGTHSIPLILEDRKPYKLVSVHIPTEEFRARRMDFQECQKVYLKTQKASTAGLNTTMPESAPLHGPGLTRSTPLCFG